MASPATWPFGQSLPGCSNMIGASFWVACSSFLQLYDLDPEPHGSVLCISCWGTQRLCITSFSTSDTSSSMGFYGSHGPWSRATSIYYSQDLLQGPFLLCAPLITVSFHLSPQRWIIAFFSKCYLQNWEAYAVLCYFHTGRRSKDKILSFTLNRMSPCVPEPLHPRVFVWPILCSDCASKVLAINLAHLVQFI